MASSQAKQWGTTPAISQAFPTDAEIAANDALIAELKAQNNFESVEETEKRCAMLQIYGHIIANTSTRKQALQLIQKVVAEFVKHVCKTKNLPQSTVDSAGGKIFTFGSYRLGVYGPGK